MGSSSRFDRAERSDKLDKGSHRSRSTDSEDERQRRRRRKAREVDKLESVDQRHRYGTKHGKSDSRDKYSGRDGERRRSRSPAYESFQRHSDRDSKRRSRRERSPDRRSVEARSPKGGSDSQVTRKNRGPLLSQTAAFKGENDSSAIALDGENELAEKQRPNFANTGLLAAASNSIAQVDGTSIVLKYHEPPEARKPPAKDVWKLFVFKGADIMETIELSTRSCWLVGRELAVVDMAAEHPSISKQHAVIQFRFIEKRNEFGDKIGKVRPYIIDLESANGTSLNKEEIPPSRYLELRDKDMIQFGHSTREYVLMLEPKDLPA